MHMWPWKLNQSDIRTHKLREKDGWAQAVHRAGLAVPLP